MSKLPTTPQAAQAMVVQTAVVRSEQQVQEVDNVRTLALCIFRQVQELREIFLYNYNHGHRMVEMGPYDAPFDYKLNQLNEKVTELRAIFEQLGPEAPAVDPLEGVDEVEVENMYPLELEQGEG